VHIKDFIGGTSLNCMQSDLYGRFDATLIFIGCLRTAIIQFNDNIPLRWLPRALDLCNANRFASRCIYVCVWFIQSNFTCITATRDKKRSLLRTQRVIYTWQQCECLGSAQVNNGRRRSVCSAPNNGRKLNHERRLCPPVFSLGISHLCSLFARKRQAMDTREADCRQDRVQEKFAWARGVI
jgi:hypothetical protein